jgi:hypothetical protein
MADWLDWTDRIYRDYDYYFELLVNLVQSNDNLILKLAKLSDRDGLLHPTGFMRRVES